MAGSLQLVSLPECPQETAVVKGERRKKKEDIVVDDPASGATLQEPLSMGHNPDSG